MPREENIIKREWLRYYDFFPQYSGYTIQSWDTASKSGELNDFSVCTTWRLIDQEFFLVDVFRQRLTFPQLKQAVKHLALQHQPVNILIEDKSSGISLVQELQVEGISGIEAYKPAPGQDKFMRFYAQSVKFASGKVHLPRQAPWLEEYIREVTGFPGVKHDDQVDSTTQALDYLGSMVSDIATWIALGKGCSG